MRFTVERLLKDTPEMRTPLSIQDTLLGPQGVHSREVSLYITQRVESVNPLSSPPPHPTPSHLHPTPSHSHPTPSCRVELSISRLPPLSSPHPGQLCCVRYSQDQRWYRGKIESVSKTGRVCPKSIPVTRFYDTITGTSAKQPGRSIGSYSSVLE